MPDAKPTATVAGQSIALHVTGYPHVPNRWGPGHIRVTGIRLDYGSSISPDARHAFITGLWIRNDGEHTDAPVDRYYDAHDGDTSTWPDWLAGLTRKHDPAVSPPAAARAGVLREEAALIRAHCPDHLDGNSAEGAWISCHCDVADDMERRADEAQQPEYTESVIYEVVGNWGVDSADSAAGARAAVAKWLKAYPKCGAYAQQRIVREWPDGSEWYGPWTELPQPKETAQDGERCEGCGEPRNNGKAHGQGGEFGGCV